MIEYFKKKKKLLLVITLGILFSIYIVNGINEHTIIPDHIHSIDDKAADERTDEDNIVILERSLQKDPGNIEVMLQLTDLYIKTENIKSAKKLIADILEIDPYNKEAAGHLKKLD